MEDKKQYWFPAKRYGWGWGFPTTWQGWLVLIVYVLIQSGLAFTLQETQLLFLIGVGTATILLIVVCWLKGEPPRWRWGSK